MSKNLTERVELIEERLGIDHAAIDADAAAAQERGEAAAELSEPELEPELEPDDDDDAARPL